MTRVNCFFCNSLLSLQGSSAKGASSLSKVATGTPGHFFCHTCETWNKYDANGDIIGDVPPSVEAQADANTISHAQPSTSQQFESDPFLCDSCITNQSIQYNLRASFDFDAVERVFDYEDSPLLSRVEDVMVSLGLGHFLEQRLEEKREDTWRQYQDSLNERYPPLCASCASSAERRLGENNFAAQLKTIELRFRQAKADNAAAIAQSKAIVDSSRRAFLQSLIMWEAAVAVWHIQRASWLITRAAALVFVVLDFFSLVDTVELHLQRNSETRKSLIAFLIIAASLLFRPWWLREAQLRSLSYKSFVHGKAEWVVAQTLFPVSIGLRLLFGLRFASFAIMGTVIFGFYAQRAVDVVRAPRHQSSRIRPPAPKQDVSSLLTVPTGSSQTPIVKGMDLLSLASPVEVLKKRKKQAPSSLHRDSGATPILRRNAPKGVHQHFQSTFSAPNDSMVIDPPQSEPRSGIRLRPPRVPLPPDPHLDLEDDIAHALSL